MSILLVQCDPQGAPRLGEVIEGLGDHLQLSAASYLVATAQHSDELFRELQRRLGRDDSLLVLNVSPSYAGPAPWRVRQWLQAMQEKHRQ